MYGSEVVAAQIATNISIKYRKKLQVMGVPILNQTFMSGDNKIVVMNTTLPSSILMKYHNAIPYHIIREVLIERSVELEYVQGVMDTFNVLRKLLNRTTHTGLIKSVHL